MLRCLKPSYSGFDGGKEARSHLNPAQLCQAHLLPLRGHKHWPWTPSMRRWPWFVYATVAPSWCMAQDMFHGNLWAHCMMVWLWQNALRSHDVKLAKDDDFAPAGIRRKFSNQHAMVCNAVLATWKTSLRLCLLACNFVAQAPCVKQPSFSPNISQSWRTCVTTGSP